MNDQILIDRAVVQQALEALEADNSKLWPSDKRTAAYFNLRAALAQQAEPLTVPAILAIHKARHMNPIEFTRAIEAAHGIKEAE